MSIYLDTIGDVCNPLSFCDKIIPGNFAWKTLKMIHRVWWLKTRKQKLVQEKDKVALALKVLFQSIIVTNPITTSAAQFLLIIVKSEETFTAYNESRKAWSAIGCTWRGDYILGKSSISKRLIPTIKKIFAYLKASFCLIMTFVDVLDTVMFSKKTSCEATLLVKNNLEKVHKYCSQNPEDLQRKLYTNKTLITMILTKTNQKKSADDFINDVVMALKDYKRISEITATCVSPIKETFNIFSMISRGVVHGVFGDPSVAPSDNPYRYYKAPRGLFITNAEGERTVKKKGSPKCGLFGKLLVRKKS